MRMTDLLKENINLSFDATKLEVEDIIQLLRVNYDDKELERTLKEADGNLWFKYAGYSSQGHSHMYDYAWYDDETEEAWCIVRLHVTLGKSGKLECDFSAMPIHQFDEEDEIDKYFKRLKP